MKSSSPEVPAFRSRNLLGVLSFLKRYSAGTALAVGMLLVTIGLEMTLPRFVRVTDVPPDATVKDRFVEFSSRYVFDPAARVLQVRRHLSAAFGHQMCSADEFANVKDDLVRIERDLDAEVVVKVVK